MSSRFAIALALCVCASALTLLAQYQVNRQIYGNSGPAAGSIRYAPQYLGAAPNIPSSGAALPSELRNAYVRSGALPSDIRMNYARIGPNAPGGAIAYIPQPTPITASAYTGAKAPGPQGNTLNPMVNSFATSGSSFGNTMNGSVRYSTPAPVVAPTAAPAPGMTNASVAAIISPNTMPLPGATLSNAAPLSQSIRYNQ
jgi:hypothetical protein